MNKEIIIDGISLEDIEKCEFCTRICKNTKEPTPLCKLFGYCAGVDCYYKQLKRKEQECEQKERDINRLKKCVYDSFKIQEDSERCWKKECNKLTQKLKEKEQECEALKQSENEAVEIIAELKNDYAELEKRHNDSFEQFKNLKMICNDYKMSNAELDKENKELLKFKEIQEKELLDLRVTLDEIEQICKEGIYDEFRRPLDECSVILDIINKAKEKINDNK